MELKVQDDLTLQANHAYNNLFDESDATSYIFTFDENIDPVGNYTLLEKRKIGQYTIFLKPYVYLYKSID